MYLLAWRWRNESLHRAPKCLFCLLPQLSTRDSVAQRNFPYCKPWSFFVLFCFVLAKEGTSTETFRGIAMMTSYKLIWQHLPCKASDISWLAKTRYMKGHQSWAFALGCVCVGGGSFWPWQLFFRNSGKTVGSSATVFAYLSIHQFRTLPEFFSPRPTQVRSLSQVKWPYLKNV